MRALTLNTPSVIDTHSVTPCRTVWEWEHNVYPSVLVVDIDSVTVKERELAVGCDMGKHKLRVVTFDLPRFARVIFGGWIDCGGDVIRTFHMGIPMGTFELLPFLFPEKLEPNPHGLDSPRRLTMWESRWQDMIGGLVAFLAVNAPAVVGGEHSMFGAFARGYQFVRGVPAVHIGSWTDLRKLPDPFA